MTYFTQKVLELKRENLFNGWIITGHRCKKDNPHLYNQQIRVHKRVDGKWMIELGGDRSIIMKLVTSETEVVGAIDEWANTKDEEYKSLFLHHAKYLKDLSDPKSNFNKRREVLSKIRELQDELERLQLEGLY